MRAVRPSTALSTSMYIYMCVYILKYGGPPADGRADTPAGGGQAGGRYTTDGNTFSRYGGREDTEGAPTWRQGRCKIYNTPGVELEFNSLASILHCALCAVRCAGTVLIIPAL
jgi:hypothetical protein